LFSHSLAQQLVQVNRDDV